MKPEHALAHTEIRALIEQLAVATDRGRIEEITSLYFPAGVLATPMWSAEGQIEMAERLRDTGALSTEAIGFLRHHLTTCHISLLGSDNADVRTYFQVWTDRGIDHCGLYLDQVMISPDRRWRVVRREVRVEYRAENSFLPITAVKGRH